MKHLETYTGCFISISRRDLERANRQELVEYLESRGSACYDDESTELPLRQTNWKIVVCILISPGCTQHDARMLLVRLTDKIWAG